MLVEISPSSSARFPSRWVTTITDESRSPCSAPKPPAEKLTSAIRSVFSRPMTPPDAPWVGKWLMLGISMLSTTVRCSPGLPPRTIRSLRWSVAMPTPGSTCSIRLTSPAEPGARRISSALKLTVLVAASSSAEK